MKRETHVFLKDKMYFKEDDVTHSYIHDQHIKLRSNKLIIITRLECLPRFDFDFTLIEFDLFKGFKVTNYSNCDIKELNGVVKNARKDY